MMTLYYIVVHFIVGGISTSVVISVTRWNAEVGKWVGMCMAKYLNKGCALPLLSGLRQPYDYCLKVLSLRHWSVKTEK